MDFDEILHGGSLWDGGPCDTFWSISDSAGGQGGPLKFWQFLAFLLFFLNIF